MTKFRTAVAVGCLLAVTQGTANAQGVTITLWQTNLGAPLFENRIAAYEEATGNTVETVPSPPSALEDTIMTRWATGERPDILEFHPTLAWLDRLNPSANLRPIGDQEFVSRNALASLAGGASDGNFYAIQTMFPEVWGAFYSTTVLEEVGLEPATTFEELKAQCATLSEAGYAPVYQGGASGWPMWGTVLTYAGTIMAEDWYDRANVNQARLTDDDSPMLAAYNYWDEMTEAGCFNSDIAIGTFESAAQAVVDGEAGYTFLPSPLLNTFADAAGSQEALAEVAGFTSIGATEQKLAVSAGPTGTFMLPKTGDEAREAAALEFLQFITSAEQYGEFVKENSIASVFSDVPDSENIAPVAQQFKDMYTQGPLAPLYNLNLVAGMTGGGDVTQSFVADEITAYQAVEELQNSVDVIAEARGLEGW